jgi:hypothetical protein
MGNVRSQCWQGRIYAITRRRVHSSDHEGGFGNVVYPRVQTTRRGCGETRIHANAYSGSIAGNPGNLVIRTK